MDPLLASLTALLAGRPEPMACGTTDGSILAANPAWDTFCRTVFAAKGGGPRANLLALLPAAGRKLWQQQLEAARDGQSSRLPFRPAPNAEGSPPGGDYLLCFAPLPAPKAGEQGWSLLVVEGQPGPPLEDGAEAVAPVPEPPLRRVGDRADSLLAKARADREQAEINLQESQDRLTQIIHGNSIATFVIDQHHRITHWNKALERLTGISSQTMVGSNCQWKAFYAHERPTMADLILDQAGEDKIRQFYTNKYIRSQLLEDSYEVEDFFELKGKGKWLFFTAAPIKSSSGALLGAVETLQDITRRKTMEREILHYQTILENKVEERTQQLKKTYEQLLHAEKLSAVGKLAASIAHEFGNPIIGIRNFLKGIQKTTSFEADDAELLQLAINECQRVRDLIRNLQSFNRPSSGTMEAMDLHQAVNDMLLFCKKSFREKRIVVKKRFAAHLPRINAVHDQVKQVILNCLNNAQEAIPAHGGSIHLSTEFNDQTVQLHIRDTGKGIHEADMVYIFEPFFSTKPAVEGTGLGLSVSYGIMKHHQGKIEVSETSARGTTFTLSFPALRGTGRAAAHAPRAPKPPARS